MLTQGTNVIYHHVDRQSQVAIKKPTIIWMVRQYIGNNNVMKWKRDTAYMTIVIHT